jgi:hypothetical protein
MATTSRPPHSGHPVPRGASGLWFKLATALSDAEALDSVVVKVRCKITTDVDWMLLGGDRLPLEAGHRQSCSQTASAKESINALSCILESTCCLAPRFFVMLAQALRRMYRTSLRKCAEVAISMRERRRILGLRWSFRVSSKPTEALGCNMFIWLWIIIAPAVAIIFLSLGR